MTNQKPTAFRADYYYQKIGVPVGTRTGHVGSVSQHLHGATTESAVLEYLRKRHPGYEISLMSLEWR